MSALDFSQLPGISIFSLQGKSAIITGGTKGLGLAMAAGLASAGANVMLVSRNAQDGEEAAGEIAEKYGVKAITFSADVANLEAMNTMAKKAKDAFGSIDVLINSAGINIRGAIDELSPEDFSKVMDINVTGTWNACRAVTPYMKDQKKGSIINLASTLGLVGLA
ncbi:MAG: SDR family NAD(P)-dependent oxidoreductase, partial [Cyclobacteriaceae bacterium]|nr:SDR family NAD(P)-dependent oxidoreductase [Cyclobacteriaceae bacterium]MDX5467528.1 SDR family NAD(P)-dependent oxidoreductase [Cyclobacteriaceae bacterium]